MCHGLNIPQRDQKTSDSDNNYCVHLGKSFDFSEASFYFSFGEMTQKCRCGKIYVTAFLDRETFRKFSHEIAFETEV